MSLISSGASCMVLFMGPPLGPSARDAPLDRTRAMADWTVGEVLRRLVLLLALSLLLPGACVLLGSTVVVASLTGSGAGGSVGAVRGAAVPGTWRVAEVVAASRCTGLSWTVLGALGFITSASGRDEGRAPPWWPAPGGGFGVESPGSRTLLEDARAAARSVCAARGNAGSLSAALLELTGSSRWVDDVDVLATALGAEDQLAAGRAQALLFAAEALGTPYQWGGNGPGTYDCSGLMVAAWRSAGVGLPRTAQEQHDATARVLGPPGPGDLLFFGSSPADVVHVGIEVGDGLMIDAPYTGAVVRIDPDGAAGAVGVGRVS